MFPSTHLELLQDRCWLGKTWSTLVSPGPPWSTVAQPWSWSTLTLLHLLRSSCWLCLVHRCSADVLASLSVLLVLLASRSLLFFTLPLQELLILVLINQMVDLWHTGALFGRSWVNISALG